MANSATTGRNDLFEPLPGKTIREMLGKCGDVTLESGFRIMISFLRMGKRWVLYPVQGDKL
jgi:hypothetical protein